MKVLKKPILIGVGIFVAGILLTGMLNRYMISKTNEISENVVDVPSDEEPVREPVKVPVLPETPKLKVAPADEEKTLVTETEKFNPQLPVSGGVMAVYTGDRPIFSETLKDYRAHPGIDIYGAVGEVVKAVEKGTVQSVYEDRRYGQTITIEHPNGFLSVYGNLDRNVSVKAGAAVLKGQAIGVVGETSLVEQSAAPHLHFEMFKEEEPINPEEYLPF
ncbi:MAG: M23 family metallopeptidase [Clostridia bacterium]|nr:M23 family metallopeptidase [Clostridia bacterium]